MKNSKSYLAVCLVFILFLGAGCKLIDDKYEKVFDACGIFDTGIKGSVSDLESILTDDFVFTINTEPPELIDMLDGIESHEVSRSEVIALVSDSKTAFQKGMEAAYANIVFLKDTATLDLVYSQSSGTVMGVFNFQLSLRDEGSFFSYDWKISICYLDSMLMGVLF